MIDRKSRDILAENLRHLASRQISNDTFEERVYKLRSGDYAVNYIIDISFDLYSDWNEKKSRCKDALSKEWKREVAKWILFLKSDKEYEWPIESRLKAWICIFLMLFGFASYLIGAFSGVFHWSVIFLLSILSLAILMAISYYRNENSGGNDHSWPFFRESDLNECKKINPFSTRPSKELTINAPNII